MVYRSLFDGQEDDDDSSYTPEELPELRRNAQQRLHLWAKRLIISVALFLSCSPVVPFSYGHSLHAYWDTFGTYLLFLSLALLFPFVMCVTLTFIAWIFLRNWQKKIAAANQGDSAE